MKFAVALALVLGAIACGAPQERPTPPMVPPSTPIPPATNGAQPAQPAQPPPPLPADDTAAARPPDPPPARELEIKDYAYTSDGGFPLDILWGMKRDLAACLSDTTAGPFRIDIDDRGEVTAMIVDISPMDARDCVMRKVRHQRFPRNSTRYRLSGTFVYR